ncbi:MAG: hypothetical protein M0C28_29600 [Candidatus Moduliflexus flocculans]|nr:hypothetical protein [Candidatus Moduliflexus flocculans]
MSVSRKDRQSIYYKELLNQLETTRPGAKLIFYLNFLEARKRGDLFVEREHRTGAPAPPARGADNPHQRPDLCSFCRMIEKANGPAVRFRLPSIGIARMTLAHGYNYESHHSSQTKQHGDSSFGKQGLWPGRRWKGRHGTAQAIRTCEAVQLDPLDVIARSQDIVLHSRVLDYKPEYLV